MILKTYAVFALLLSSATVFGQTVSSSLVGTVVDPADAVVSNVPVALVNQDTGASRSANTDGSGTFRFLNLTPGTYRVTITAQGFKTLSQTDIVVAAEETRSAGKMVLQIGSLSDSVSVTADTTAIQLASSEKAQTVDGNQLNDVTLKGRDLFGYLRLVPGVVDTSATRDVTGPNQISGITINGNTSAKNFTVDGITDMDTGSNTTLHYEPNIDAIQELKVLSSNYQAEFGRNSGGTITVVTKNGTQQFHGTAMWNHRHEEFNANSWVNNHNVVNGAATPIVPYRYNVETYSIGGPVFIPKHLNKNKTRLFFFGSQEYTGQFVAGVPQSKYTPTALERVGNFSQSFNNNGTPIKVLDPQNNNTQFSGNLIPESRITPVGQAMLNFFPLPNFTPTLPAQLNVINYFEQGSATHPRRNDVVRVDFVITSKLSGYFRYINDHDDMLQLYQGVSFTSDVGGTLGAKGIAPIDHPNPGHSYSATATYTITPTLINEATVGESWNTWAFYSPDNYASEDRGLVPGVPSLFPVPKGVVPGYSAVNSYQNLLPTFSFGSPPSNSMAYSRVSNTAGAFENFNPIWTYLDNISKVVGPHTFKAGFYLEHNDKLEPFGENYMGAFNFGPTSANLVNNTGDGYANGLMGYVGSYSQTSAVTTYNTVYWNAEFYVQDSWKVNRRLTLDLGVRFYHQTPQVDLNKTFDNFLPARYSASAMPHIYVAGCTTGAATCTGATRQAEDPFTKTFAPVTYIGLFVPNTGDPASGMVQLGTNGVSL
ncbi:MAG TPA: carboxypeptidase-like regulatory domain-containing protein, partial [Bryobacteraceae bacterium]